MTLVDPTGWREAVASVVADGFVWPDFLTGIDGGDAITVVARLLRPADGAPALVTAQVPAGDPRIASVADLVPGLGWHEREAADLLGLVFDGSPDRRPLVRRDRSEEPALRRGTVLAARVARPWPGAAEPEVRIGAEGMQRRSGNPSRRRQRPPGVPEGRVES